MWLKHIGEFINGIFIGISILTPLFFAISIGAGLLGSLIVIPSWVTIYIIHKRDKEGYVPKEMGWL